MHPLRKIPGPKLFAVSGLPQAIDNQIRGLFNHKVLKLHQTYGDMVRTGPNHLSISGTIAWPEVFGHGRSGRPEFSHWDDFYKNGDESHKSIFVTDKENHRRHRRLMAYAFSDVAIKEQEMLMKQYVNKLFAHLREDAVQGKPTDMLKWYNFTTFDIIGDLVFGEPFNCLDTSNFHPWVDMVFASLKAGTQGSAFRRMPLIYWTQQLFISKEALRMKNEHKAMSIEKTERRIALGSAPDGRKDIMTYILRHNDEKGMSHGEILSNCNSLILAGSETTATALSGLTYYVTTNPEALKRVQQEVRTAFSTEEDISIAATSPLQYLRACIEEAMRMYPPVVETPPRISPGEFVNGHFVPKGVSEAWRRELPRLTRPSRLKLRSISGLTTAMPATLLCQIPLSLSDGSIPITLSTTRNSARTRSRRSSPSPSALETASAKTWHMQSYESSLLGCSGTSISCCSPKVMDGRINKECSRYGKRFHCESS